MKNKEKKVDLLTVTLNGQGTVPVGVETEEEAKGGSQEAPHKHSSRDQSP
jgi:hypothetical protein